MSSFSVRAFATVVSRSSRFGMPRAIVTPNHHQQIVSRQPTARYMSDEPDTSVVEICTDKIKGALETDNVIVTGE